MLQRRNSSRCRFLSVSFACEQRQHSGAPSTSPGLSSSPAPRSFAGAGIKERGPALGDGAIAENRDGDPDNAVVSGNEPGCLGVEDHEAGHGHLSPAARPPGAQRCPLERCSNSNSPGNDPTRTDCHDLPAVQRWSRTTNARSCMTGVIRTGQGLGGPVR